jgi:hypothetical protein
VIEGGKVRRVLGIGLTIVAFVVRRLVGFGLIFIAFVVLAVVLIGLAHPVSAKMSDDGDPFGDPYQPWWMHGNRFAIIAITFLAGFRLAILGRLGRDRSA